jgi:hypothetical protein
MPTTYDTPLADLPARWLDASTRALSASAELYAGVLQSQAAVTRQLVEAYAGLGARAAGAGAETADRAERATAEVTRGTAAATRRATRRTATATRKAAKPATRAAKPATRAATPATPAAKPATPAAKAAVAAPIAGYDDLTADDLVAKLAEQSQATLAQVAAYEQAHAKRATVLERVAALTGREPAPGYDELTAEEAQKLVTGGDAALAAAVRDYERRHKARASVLDAAARNAD